MRASAAYRSEFSPDGRRGPASPSSRLRRHATTLRLYPLVVEAAQCLPAARVGAPLVVCEAAQFGRVLGNLLVDEVVAGGREIHEPRPVVRGANFVPQGRAVARGRALHHVGQPQRRVSLGRRLVCVEEGGALKHCEPPLLNLPQPKDSLGGLPRRLDHLRLAGGRPEECVTEALDLRRPLQARVAREEAVPQGRRRPAWLCHCSARLPVLDSLRQLALDEGSGLGTALHHLNYLIAEPIQAAVVYRSGILVQIPRPERFAIHKLIAADRRLSGPEAGKARKDLMQAEFLIEALAEDRPDEIAEAYQAALKSGPKWRERIEATLRRAPRVSGILQGLG